MARSAGVCSSVAHTSRFLHPQGRCGTSAVSACAAGVYLLQARRRLLLLGIKPPGEAHLVQKDDGRSCTVQDEPNLLQESRIKGRIRPRKIGQRNLKGREHRLDRGSKTGPLPRRPLAERYLGDPVNLAGGRSLRSPGPAEAEFRDRLQNRPSCPSRPVEAVSRPLAPRRCHFFAAPGMRPKPTWSRRMTAVLVRSIESSKLLTTRRSESSKRLK